MMQDLWKCELYWFRKHCQKLSTKEAKNPDLIAGGHIAKACEIVRKSYYNSKLSVDSAIEEGCNYIINASDTGDYTKSNERLALCLQKYFERFPLDDNLIPVKLANGEHAIEYEFAFDLGIEHPDIPGQNLVYKGKLDGLFERVHLGRRVSTHVVDEKSTSSVYRLEGTKLIDLVKEENLYRTEGQFIGYHWAARQLGVQTNSSLIYKIPILKEFEHAFQLEVPITDFLVEIWSTTLVNKIEELKEKYLYHKKSGLIPHVAFYPALTNSACNSYGRYCMFSEGCKGDRAGNGEAILKMQYQQTVWDSEKKKSISLKDYKQQRGIV
jgi:hypothetical protein